MLIYCKIQRIKKKKTQTPQNEKNIRLSALISTNRVEADQVLEKSITICCTKK